MSGGVKPGKSSVYRLSLGAMFLALALVLPFLTGQIPQIGNMLCPMHIPVLLCGFFCGAYFGLAVGFCAPLLRFVLFGMPPVIPTGICMCFELAVYGFTAGLLYKLLPKKKISVYLSLICAMLAGRIVWGTVGAVLYGLGRSQFGWAAFVSGAFVNSIPGILIQIILVPAIVILAKKYIKT